MVLKSSLNEEKVQSSLNAQVLNGLQRKEILDHYADHKLVDDESLKELSKERKKISDQIRGNGAELKAITDKLQKQAAQIMTENTKLVGAKEYIDSKIIERHNVLQNTIDSK